MRRAESLGAARMLNAGLALATGLCDAPVPPAVQQRIEADRRASDVASEILTRLMSRKYRPLDAAGRFNFRRRMLPETLAGWRYATRLSVIPSEDDWEMVRLPGLLSPLYIALRPLRLLQKYGWSRRKT